MGLRSSFSVAGLAISTHLLILNLQSSKLDRDMVDQGIGLGVFRNRRDPDYLAVLVFTVMVR
jgi:hypothetical protein